MKQQIQKMQLLEAQISEFLEDATKPLPPNKVMENPNFRKWFGDSKVVDSNGNPLVMLHGTRASFNAFANKGSHTNHPSAQIGYWFTDDISIANDFAGATGMAFYRGENGMNVIPVYLSIQNPKIYSPKTHAGDPFKQMSRDMEENSDLVSMLKSKGFDGIFLEKTKMDAVANTTSNQWVAFDANQIKSIYNNGQFSTTSNNISEACLYSDESTYRLTPKESSIAYNLYEKARDIAFLAEFMRDNPPKEIQRLFAYLMDALKSSSKNESITFTTQKQIKKIVANLLEYLQSTQLSDKDRDVLMDLFLGLRDFNEILEGAEVLEVVDAN